MPSPVLGVHGDVNRRHHRRKIHLLVAARRSVYRRSSPAPLNLHLGGSPRRPYPHPVEHAAAVSFRRRRAAGAAGGGRALFQPLALPATAAGLLVLLLAASARQEAADDLSVDKVTTTTTITTAITFMVMH